MRWMCRIDREIDSRTTYTHLKRTTTPMSRANLINFPNLMAEEGFLTYRETTPQGGRKRIYKPSEKTPDEESFRKALTCRIIDKSRSELEGNSRS